MTPQLTDLNCPSNRATWPTALAIHTLLFTLHTAKSDFQERPASCLRRHTCRVQYLLRFVTMLSFPGAWVLSLAIIFTLLSCLPLVVVLDYVCFPSSGKDACTMS